MKELWDKRYSSQEYVYGTAPNEYLATELRSLKPGRILLPADGEGRNGVFAAELGWDVLCFDQSEEGRLKALSLANSRGVDIDYRIASVPGFKAGSENFDCIALIYFHLPPALRADFHKSCIEALKPGGVLILEAFDLKQLGKSSGGPQSPELLMTMDQLREDFEELQNLEITQCRITLREGNLHEGAAEVLRVLGRKT